LADRLDAYRAKHPEAATPPRLQSPAPRETRSSKIARSVASRYAAAPSYGQLLLAISEAEQAVRDAQEDETNSASGEPEANLQKGSRDLDQSFHGSSRSEGALAFADHADAADADDVGPGGSSHQSASEEIAADTHADRQNPHTGIPILPRFSRKREAPPRQKSEPEPSLEDLWASALVEPRTSLPSKLIEFPRELVSSHRAKLPDPEIPHPGTQAAFSPDTSQLRIFEAQPSPTPEDDLAPAVETQSDSPLANGEWNLTEPASSPGSAVPLSGVDPRSTAPDSEPRPIKFENPELARRGQPHGSTLGRAASYRTAGSAAVSSYTSDFAVEKPFKGLEWASISLDRDPSSSAEAAKSGFVERIPFLLDPAPIALRFMAFAVDFSLVTGAFFAFVFVFTAVIPRVPTGLMAAALGGAVYGSLWLLYQVLFFSLRGATPGMLYARIGLCTFDDRNPTPIALRRRLAAWWLSCLPGGMGFLWCFVDEDNLSWHDRITRTYQRTY
jgi:uncharacterized RDD family membrane protein YckC